MARNTTFKPQREPFHYTDILQLNKRKVHGPLSFLNPTRAQFEAVNPDTLHTPPSSYHTQHICRDSVLPADVAFEWTARNNRKGRHTLVYDKAAERDAAFTVPVATNSWKQVLHCIWRMFTYCPVWYVMYAHLTRLQPSKQH